MQTDNLFYLIFLRNPQLIAELLPDIPTDCEFELSAPVVKERRFSLDGLLQPVGDDPQLPLVFLEAQMQPDKLFYGRYFAEIFLYLYHYEVVRPWYGLLILPHRRVQLGGDRPYQKLLGDLVHCLYLEDLLTLTSLSRNLMLLKLLVVKEQETIPLAQQILRATPDYETFVRQLDIVEAILANRFPKLSPQEILKMLDIKTADLKQTRFYQELMQQGQAEGRLEGRLEGQRAMILRQLTRRFGVLTPVWENEIGGLTLAELELLGEALLDFTGLADLEAWLLGDRSPSE